MGNLEQEDRAMQTEVGRSISTQTEGTLWALAVDGFYWLPDFSLWIVVPCCAHNSQIR